MALCLVLRERSGWVDGDLVKCESDAKFLCLVEEIRHLKGSYNSRRNPQVGVESLVFGSRDRGDKLACKSTGINGPHNLSRPFKKTDEANRTEFTHSKRFGQV